MENKQRQAAAEVSKIMVRNAQRYGRTITPDPALTNTMAKWAIDRELSIKAEALKPFAEAMPSWNEMKEWDAEQWREWCAQFGLDLEWAYSHARTDEASDRAEIETLKARKQQRSGVYNKPRF